MMVHTMRVMRSEVHTAPAHEKGVFVTIMRSDEKSTRQKVQLNKRKGETQNQKLNMVSRLRPKSKTKFPSKSNNPQRGKKGRGKTTSQVYPLLGN